MDDEQRQILADDERPLTPEVARKVIDQIRGDHGHISDADAHELDKTSPEFQERFRRRAAKSREVYASYTTLVSNQLYGSIYRFIYELIQNADDSEYAYETEPCMTFRIRPHEIVVETNEVGFTCANVQAICATGESSKAKDENTTGEKGLGFKSVFGIAERVHVRSGNWSFRFQHQRGENGLGMVTPLWTSFEENLPAGVGTRFTLSYAETEEDPVPPLVAEMDEIDATVVFALRKLKRLVIAFEGVVDRNWTRTIAKSYSPDSTNLRIFESRKGPSLPEPRTSKLDFKVFSIIPSDLPHEPLRRSGQSRRIQIAFQFNSDTDKAVVPDGGQYVFAFLPIQRLAQLPFLIQADFVLAANREAIPKDKKWNIALRYGIALAFKNAVETICRNPKHILRYQWPNYLPVEHMGGFWQPFYASIKALLRDCAILESRKHTTMQLPRQLREVPAIFRHAGKPILPDLSSKDVYLSAKYSHNHLARLMELGLEYLSESEMVDRLTEDVRCAKSVFREKALDNNWHASFQSFITKVSSVLTLRCRVRQLEIIPLSTGSWNCADSLSPVYFPILVQKDSICLQIPSTLGLKKLHPEACKDAASTSFYSSQGVTNVSQQVVIQRILAAQRQKDASSTFFHTSDALEHLEILFWYGEKPQIDLWASDQVNWRRTSKLYFPSNDPFHAQKLIGSRPWKEVPDFGMLESAYLNSHVNSSVQHGCTWQQWLETVGKVRYFPRLAYYPLPLKGPILDPLLRVVSRANSVRFLSNLKAHWSDYEYDCVAAIKDEIKKIEVACRNGQTMKISATFLPTQVAISEARRYGVDTTLPFLELGIGDVVENDSSWDILSNFGVGCALDRRFYFEVLRHLPYTSRAAADLLSSCVSLYTKIAQKSVLGEANLLKSDFEKYDSIYIPSPAGVWTTSRECVWVGPKALQSKYCLETIYGKHHGVKLLFADLISIRNVHYHDVLQDLLVQRERLSGRLIDDSRQRLTELYEELDGMKLTQEDCADLRQRFESESLIGAHERWIKPSVGIWNCTVELSGKVPLEDLFPELRSFFTEKLEVKVMNPVLLLEEIAKTASNVGPTFNSSVLEDIKKVMLPAGQILALDCDDEKLKEPVKALKRLAFLPVRGPKGSSLRKTSAEFFIVDHERYGSAFKGRLELLDFPWTDMTSLHPLFQLLGLEGKYLSRHVETETTFESADFNDDLTTQFRSRAYALSCCAISHQSPLYLNQSDKLYNILLNAEVLMSENMRTSLIVTIDHGQTEVTAESDRALVKVKKSAQGLKIYVPSDVSGLCSCYRTELPAEVLKILGIEDSGAAKQIYRILNDEGTTLRAIMSDEDIPRVKWLTEPPEPSLVGATPQPVSAITGTGHVLVTPSLSIANTEVPSTPRTPPNISRQFVGGFLPPTPRASPIGQLGEALQKRAYRQLLENVTRQARAIPQRFRIGSTSTPSLANAFHPNYDLYTLRQALNTEYDHGGFLETSNTRIGAAGELFVYELLRALQMPNFTIDNWQSKIRSNVRSLTEYQNLDNWAYPEISDIMYKDADDATTTTNAMETFLRTHSHNRNEIPTWPPRAANSSSSQIQYLLEVKTTTGPCVTPFFMSRNQYQLMRQHSLSSQAGRPRTVFVIMRVYNLLSPDDIGLEIYIDPWSLKDEVLEFVADPWKVIPPAPAPRQGQGQGIGEGVMGIGAEEEEEEEEEEL